MDVKYLLSSVANEAAKLGASGKLLAGVRLTGAVNGERGEGYLLRYEDDLVLLYRILGNTAYGGICGEIGEWSFADYREEKYALMLTLSLREQSYSCEFTPAERESAENILNAITAAHADPQTIYPEKTLIMAGLFCYLAEGEHEKYAVELLGKELFKAAGKYTATHTLPDLLEAANSQFTAEEKNSVLINLIEQRMSDDLWSSQEAAALRELADVWSIDQQYMENCAQVLLMRSKLWTLFNN